MDKILVTGASGFIGSFIVEEALNRGMEVWAAVRKSSSKEYLQDKRIRFVELDLGNAERLKTNSAVTISTTWCMLQEPQNACIETTFTALTPKEQKTLPMLWCN